MCNSVESNVNKATYLKKIITTFSNFTSCRVFLCHKVSYSK